MSKDKTKQSDIAIKVENISKNFARHQEKVSIKSSFVNIFKKIHRQSNMDFKVLKNVSFEVNKGDFFGIVGRNGSGKSTLLKIIAEIYQPTSGKVTVDGSLVPFIELGVGFNPELTGRENVFLNGALLGFSRQEMEEKYDDIVKFAELEQFMDEKLKNYSSGMQVRLAFSVAIRADADILVLDEVLAVGDEAFQKKCQDYFYKLKRAGKTVILVTHSMESVRNFCNKAVLIDKGLVVASGNPDKVAGHYSEMFQNEYAANVKDKATKANDNQYIGGDVQLKSVTPRQFEADTRLVKFKNDFSLNLEIESVKAIDDVTMGVHIVHQSGQTITAITTKTFNAETNIVKGLNKFSFKIQNIFSEGDYSLNIALKQKDQGEFLIQASDMCHFSVVGVDSAKYNQVSLVYPDVELNISQ